MNTKSIKEFFRPTKIKLLLFWCLVLIFLVELLYSIDPRVIWFPTVVFIFYISFYLGYFLFSTTSFFTLVTFLTICYLFSCLIIYFYNYFRKSKHKSLKPIFIMAIILVLFIPIPTGYKIIIPEDLYIESK